MAEVPKIVRERLKAGGTATASHPDADMLTAFAERSLSARERDGILDHLSRCGDCREIVTLALPAGVAAEMPVVRARGKWLVWPVLRWGFAAAGFVLVASFGIVQYQRHNREVMAPYKVAVVSQPENKAVPEVPSPAPAASAAAPTSRAREERDKSGNFDSALTVKSKKAEDKALFAPAAVPPPPVVSDEKAAGSLHGAVGGTLSHGPKMGIQMNQANQWQQNANALNASSAAHAAAAPAAQAPANVPANGRSTSSLIQTQQEPVPPAADNLIVQSQDLSQQVPSGGTAESKVDRAKPLETVIVSNARNYRGTPPSARLARSTAAVGARWTINAGGTLQRSLDQGASWQDVNVNESTGLASAGELTVVAKEQPQAAQQEATLKDQKQSPGLIFRAVAANGVEVWAGGLGGMLYHSTDAGSHWARVLPTSSGAVLTGDVVSVSFPDAQHGRISTSTSEVWTTADDGQTWQKQ